MRNIIRQKYSVTTSFKKIVLTVLWTQASAMVDALFWWVYFFSFFFHPITVRNVCCLRVPVLQIVRSFSVPDYHRDWKKQVSEKLTSPKMKISIQFHSLHYTTFSRISCLPTPRKTKTSLRENLQGILLLSTKDDLFLK